MRDKIFFNPWFKLSKNKTLELQFGNWRKDSWSWFDFSIKLTRKQDHAGFRFYAEIIGLHFILEIYDNRHFDYENNCWEKYIDSQFNN